MESMELFVLLLFASIVCSDFTLNNTGSNLDSSDEFANKTALGNDKILKNNSTENVTSSDVKENVHEDFSFQSGQIPMIYPETHLDVTKRMANATTNEMTGVMANAKENFNRTLTEVTGDNSSTNASSWKCNKPIDLLFLLDSSESVKYGGWQLMLQFVRDLSSMFERNSSNVGVVRYDSTAEVPLPIQHFGDQASLSTALSDVYYNTGGTRLDLALKRAAELFDGGPKSMDDQSPARSRVVIILTDGPTNRIEINKDTFVEGRELLTEPAETLKRQGVAIFCIGVQPDDETNQELQTMKDELDLVSSNPSERHVFIPDGFRDMQNQVEVISRAACVVNGGWGQWSEYSPCSVTCGVGTKVRKRICNSPPAENNGSECPGPNIESERCDLSACTLPKGTTPNATETSSKPTESTSNVNATVVPQGTSIHLLSNQSSAIDLNSNKDAVPLREVAEGEGMEELVLGDSNYTASSECTRDTGDPDIKNEFSASMGRLHNVHFAGAWCAERDYAKHRDMNQYLQVDIGSEAAISAIGTQGSHAEDSWVTSYHLNYSKDGMEWSGYSKDKQADTTTDGKSGDNRILFSGNNDRDTLKMHILRPPICARFFRFNPHAFKETLPDGDGHGDGKICMRAGLYRSVNASCVEISKTQQSLQNTTTSEDETHNNASSKEEIVPPAAVKNAPDVKLESSSPTENQNIITPTNNSSIQQTETAAITPSTAVTPPAAAVVPHIEAVINAVTTHVSNPNGLNATVAHQAALNQAVLKLLTVGILGADKVAQTPSAVQASTTEVSSHYAHLKLFRRALQSGSSTIDAHADIHTDKPHKRIFKKIRKIIHGHGHRHGR